MLRFPDAVDATFSGMVIDIVLSVVESSARVTVNVYTAVSSTFWVEVIATMGERVGSSAVTLISDAVRPVTSCMLNVALSVTIF